MKASDLRKLYLSVVNLYGFVFSKDLFKILDHYKIPYKKEQILKDLQIRADKITRSYCVQKMRGTSYLIIDPMFDNEQFQKLCEQKQDKPRYFPKTYEKLLEYSNFSYKDEKEQEGFNNLYAFLKRHSNEEEYRLRLIVDLVLSILKNHFDNPLNDVFSIFKLCSFDFSDTNSLGRFTKILQDVSNNLRIPSNNGFTPAELFKMRGPADINNVALTIGPNMWEAFLNGARDPYEFLKQLNNSNLPRLMKESFKRELLEIIAEIERTPKA